MTLQEMKDYQREINYYFLDDTDDGDENYRLAYHLIFETENGEDWCVYTPSNSKYVGSGSTRELATLDLVRQLKSATESLPEGDRSRIYHVPVSKTTTYEVGLVEFLVSHDKVSWSETSDSGTNSESDCVGPWWVRQKD